MKHRILVVDDEESIRFTFSEFLCEGGYAVDTASNASEALGLIESESLLESGSFDVIFLDILLGTDSGISVLKAAKELNPNCPVIMITGSPEISTAAAAVKYAAFDYLVKPVTQEELVKHAEKAITFKLATDERDRFQKRMLALFQSVREGILIFDSDFQLIEINYAATQLLGLRHDVLGKALSEIAARSENEILNTLKELLESRLEGELYKINFKNNSGENLCLGVSISPLKTATGKDNDLVVVLRDESKEPEVVDVAS